METSPPRASASKMAPRSRAEFRFAAASTNSTNHRLRISPSQPRLPRPWLPLPAHKLAGRFSDKEQGARSRVPLLFSVNYPLLTNRTGKGTAFSHAAQVRSRPRALAPEDRFYFFSAARKSNAAEFMQYRSPVGAGPSSNTCPRCASHFAQRTSVRAMPNVESRCSITLLAAPGLKKLGQPVPELNFVCESNSGAPQHTQ